MNLKIYIDKDKINKNIEIDSNVTVSGLLSLLKINPVTVIVARNNEIVMEDEVLKDKDEIDILSVVSGG